MMMMMMMMICHYLAYLKKQELLLMSLIMNSIMMMIKMKTMSPLQLIQKLMKQAKEESVKGVVVIKTYLQLARHV